MYQWVKPKCVIPVHGEHRHMIEHINFAKEMQVPNPVQVENGDIVRLYPGEKPEVYDKALPARCGLLQTTTLQRLVVQTAAPTGDSQGPPRSEQTQSPPAHPSLSRDR